MQICCISITVPNHLQAIKQFWSGRAFFVRKHFFFPLLFAPLCAISKAAIAVPTFPFNLVALSSNDPKSERVRGKPEKNRQVLGGSWHCSTDQSLFVSSHCGPPAGTLLIFGSPGSPVSEGRGCRGIGLHLLLPRHWKGGCSQRCFPQRCLPLRWELWSGSSFGLSEVLFKCFVSLPDSLNFDQ